MSASTHHTKSAADAAPAHAEQAKPAPVRRPRRGPWLWLVLLAAAVVGGWFGWQRWQFARVHETTDNAQIEGHIDPVIPRVAGTVVELRVADNERVMAGQVLIQLDTRDLDSKVAQAEAALAQSDADLAAKRALVAVVEANLVADDVSLRQAEDDVRRDTELFEGRSLAERELTKAKFDLEAARAKHGTLQAQLLATRAQVALSEAAVLVRQRDLEFARLQLGYATVVAPASGVVSRRNVELGQYVQPGQSLLAITGEEDLWITANFKETQLDGIRAGARVRVRFDAYPDHDYDGHVVSFAGATGAKFSLLPPDNATGNFVKVTQRVPVRIALDTRGDASRPLRLGLSAFVTVETAP